MIYQSQRGSLNFPNELLVLEEQRLSVETERRAFEMETAFARRERARDRELDELKLELDRVTMEANEAARVAAAREKRLALPAPGGKKKERRRRERSVSSDRSDASESLEADDDETSVAAKLARAVLRALDERAGAPAGAHTGGQSGGFAGWGKAARWICQAMLCGGFVEQASFKGLGEACRMVASLGSALWPPGPTRAPHCTAWRSH